jgi:two-component system, NarL family, response regulator YdfI
LQKDNEPIPIQVLITAAFPAMRAGLRALVESDSTIKVAAEAASPAVWGSQLQNIQVIVLAPTNQLPEEWLDIIRQKAANIPVLFLLSRPLNNLGDFEGLTWGALSLTASSDEMSLAIRALAMNLWVAQPAIIQELLKKQVISSAKTPNQPIEPLTKRETQILQCLAEGFTNKEIAVRLKISPQTVKFHVASIFSKLAINNRTEAVRNGVRLGLINL